MGEKQVFKIAMPGYFKLVYGKKLKVTAYGFEFMYHEAGLVEPLDSSNPYNTHIITEISSGFAIASSTSKNKALYKLNDIIQRIDEKTFKAQIEKAKNSTKHFKLEE